MIPAIKKMQIMFQDDSQQNKKQKKKNKEQKTKNQQPKT